MRGGVGTDRPFAALVIALIVAPAAFGRQPAAAPPGSPAAEGEAEGEGRWLRAASIVVQLLFRIPLLGHGLGLLVLVALGLMWWFATRGMPKLQVWRATRAGAAAAAPGDATPERERRVELAAAEAAEDDPDFAPDHVRATATQLFMEIQQAWDAGDRSRCTQLVSPDLCRMWTGGLTTSTASGWRNRVEPAGDPTSTTSASTTPATTRRSRPDRSSASGTTSSTATASASSAPAALDRRRIREFWTLGKRDGRWVLASIEQGAEGKHALEDEIVASAWSDEAGMRDEALIEGAVADQVRTGTKVAEVADLEYDGDARAAAMDLSLADGRFAPDVLEVAARRAVAAWAQAVDGDDAVLKAVATPAARASCCTPAMSQQTRLVVRGPRVNHIRIVTSTPPPSRRR